MANTNIRLSLLSLLLGIALSLPFIQFSIASGQGLTVETDNGSYSTGDMITITGQVDEREPGATVHVEITDPHGNKVWGESATVTADNTFEVTLEAGQPQYSFSEDVMDNSGTYLVTATYITADFDLLAEDTTFEFTTDESSPDIPAPDEQEEGALSFSLASMAAQDTNGNDIGTSLRLGQQIMLTFDSTNSGNSAQPYVALLQVYSEEGDTIYITWQTGTSSVGETTNSGFAWQPAQAGKYTVKAFVWSSLGNPTPLSEPSEMEITVA